MKRDEINTFFDDISPDSEQKERMLSNILKAPSDAGRNTGKGVKHVSLIAFAAAMVLVTTAVFAATNGGFEWLMSRFRPSLGEIAVKVEKFCIDQDIKMEVIGAQMYDTKAVVYLSIQDISGQNRITENTDFGDSFYVKSDIPEEATASGYGRHTESLGFDKAANTLYIEITLESDWPLSDPLTLGGTRMYFDKTEYDFEPVDIDLTKAAEAETIPVTEEQSASGSVHPDYGVREPNKILKPGYYAAMPHGDEGQWISNIGIIDGRLHVQVTSVYGEFGPNDPGLKLISEAGEEIYGYYTAYYADENGAILGSDDFDNITYKHADFIFYDVDIEKLADYKLHYLGTVYYGIEGKWEVAAYTGDSSAAIRRASTPIDTEDFIIEQITLTPLGLYVRGEGKLNGGRRAGEIFSVDLSAVLITDGAEISLNDGGSGWNNEDRSFHSNWDTEEPLDVSSVKAVRINGVTVELE